MFAYFQGVTGSTLVWVGFWVGLVVHRVQCFQFCSIRWGFAEVSRHYFGILLGILAILRSIGSTLGWVGLGPGLESELESGLGLQGTEFNDFNQIRFYEFLKGFWGFFRDSGHF